MIEPNGITTTITVDSNASCYGIADGGVTVVRNGGTIVTDYSYLWDDPNAQNTASATNLAAGTYTVTVTDDNGCSTIDNVTISEPDALYAIPLLVNHVSCNGLTDGSATVLGAVEQLPLIMVICGMTQLLRQWLLQLILPQELTPLL